MTKKIKDLKEANNQLEVDLEKSKSKFSQEAIYSLKSQNEVLKSEKSYLEKEIESKNKSLAQYIKKHAILKHKNITKNEMKENVYIDNSSRLNDEIGEHDDKQALSSTKKPGMNNVNSLVEELDNQIQQVLTDLDR
ncbi:MAG: hypothetical protein MHPSP_000853 [Paramarteilia canceri]